jgi:sugar/nucleoside kinase (ribokinase family)
VVSHDLLVISQYLKSALMFSRTAAWLLTARAGYWDLTGANLYNSNKITFYAVSPAIADIPELIAKVLMNPRLDILGLNENELNHYSRRINKTQDEMIAAVESLQRKIHARIDIHTSLFSCSVHPTSIVVPTISLSTIYRTTGAGDAWNAANLFADLLGFFQAFDSRIHVAFHKGSQP